MAKGTQAKYSGNVSISAQSIAQFLDMLANEGLREKFLAEAPQAKTILAAGQSGKVDQNILGAKAGVTPKTLAGGIDKLSATATDVTDEVWKASLSVEPELMEFARSFAMSHKLTNYPIAKSLKVRRCGNGIECPPGQ